MARASGEAISRAFESGAEQHFGFAIEATGQRRHFVGRAIPERGVQGQVDAVLCIIHDDIGFSATTIWMVEQLGLAMMLRSRKPASASAVDLGHDQRHVLVHAELRGVVDHHAAGRRGARRMHLGHRGAGREQAEVEALEVEVLERRCTLSTWSSPKLTSLPAEPSEASATTSSDRKLPLGEDFSISCPTAPVAPTTATL